RKTKAAPPAAPSTSSSGEMRAATAPSGGASAAADVRLDYAVVYIHGIGHQDPPHQAKANWDTALFGSTMSDTVMAYWSDIRYPTSSDVVGAARTRATTPTDAALQSNKARQFMNQLQQEIANVAEWPAAADARTRVLGNGSVIGGALFRW